MSQSVNQGHVSAGTTIRVNVPASAEEAAAIAAATERFRLETSGTPEPADSGPGPWSRAALVEGVSSKDGFGPRDPGGLY